MEEHNGPKDSLWGNITIVCICAGSQIGGFISSHGVLLGPAAGCRLVLRTVCLVYVSNLRDKRIIWVGICEQRADRKQNLKHERMVVSCAAIQ